MSTRLHLDFNVPEALSPRLRVTVVRALREEAVLGLFKRRLCSGGFAAKLLGISVHDFLDLLKRNGIPYSDESKAAAQADRRTLAWLERRAKQRVSRR